MKFRPCIDIHNGKVKQIVGGSLMDTGNRATENFVAQQTAAYFAGLYQSKKLVGGHIILLNPVSSEFYEQTKHQAMEALKTYPGGLQIGGGITPENAGEYVEAGASHVIVTSYVFKDGVLHYERLRKMEQAVSKKHLVLDLSCRKRDGSYYIVTDRWQKYTDKTIHKHNHQYISNVRTDKIITYVQSYQYLYTKYYQKADNVKYPFLHFLFNLWRNAWFCLRIYDKMQMLHSNITKLIAQKEKRIVYL